MAEMESFDLDKFELKSLNNLAIIASAGTGKTYSICGMVNKLVKDGVDLKKILIVTYTEKAAEELKNRIRGELPTADIDNATIGTIHSFCQQTIEEFCVASGKPSDLELIDESEAFDFAKQYIRTENPLAEITNIKRYICGLEAKERNIEIENAIVKYLCCIPKEYYLNKSNAEEKDIISLTCLFDERLLACCENIMHRRPVTDGNKNGVAKALETAENSSNNDLRTIANNVKSSGNFAFIIPNSLKKNKKDYSALSNDEKDAFELLKNARELHKRDLILQAFAFLHAKDFYIKWQEEKAKRSVQTFNDMIRNVREEVVNKGPLLKSLQDKYQIAIIDEFQDTNQKQWDIFKNVFLSDGHNIIVVLDPKQSIYSFQGSDSHVCDAAVNEIVASGGKKVSLNVNFRASKIMIESTGKFFSNVNALPQKMEFRSSDYGKKFEATYKSSDIPAYWIWENNDNESKNDEKSNNLSEQLSDQEKFARIVCQTIIDCCSKDNGKTRLQIEREQNKDSYYWDNVSFKDFAILAKTRTSELPIIKKALEESGIPYTQYKDTSVFNGIECANWIAVLDAINAPDFSGRNRTRFRKALYTSFFDYSLEEINASVFDKDNIPEILLFDKWRAATKGSDWENLINSIIIDTGLESRLNSLKDLKSLGIFKQIGDYCIDYLAKSQSIEALIINLKKRQKKQKDEEENEDGGLAGKSTDFDCVKLMTIHASKGLEFPIVISFGGFKGPKNDGVYNYHDAEGHKLTFCKPIDFGVDNYTQERTEEWQRLFYVAYTRAKYILVLPNYKNTGEDFIKDSIEGYINAKYSYRRLIDNNEGFETLKTAAKAILSSNTKTVDDSITKDQQKDILKSIIKSKKKLASYKHSYCTLSNHKAKAERITDNGLDDNNAEDEKKESVSKYDVCGVQINSAYDDAISPITLSEDFPAGKGLGNAIHKVFELIDYQGTVKTDGNKSLIDSLFANEGFGKTCKWRDDVYAIVENVINADLPEIHGSEGTGKKFKIRDLSFEDRKNEIEFNFNNKDEKLKNYFNGFIDLVFKRDDYYSILDWKSDKLTEVFSSYSNGAIVKKHIDDLYSIQRVLYSYCLIKWLKNFYKELSEQEIFEKHFGGVYYVCIRGCKDGTGNGIYAHTWKSFADLEEAYIKIVNERIGKKH